MAANNVPTGFEVTIEPAGYAVVSMVSEPVNTLSLDFWKGLTSILDACEADPKVRGILLRSGLKRDVFTAGNDIKELYAPMTSGERYKDFWLSSNKFLARLYASPLVTVAAIRGACPAGGCCISMACDYRVMTENGHIGLNEVALGISVPKKWMELMSRIIGGAATERLCLNAKLLSPREALEVGLVNEVVPKAQLESTATAVMQSMLKFPDSGRAVTKKALRAEFSESWIAYSHTEHQGAWKMLSSDAVTKALAGVLARLSGKKANL